MHDFAFIFADFFVPQTSLGAAGSGVTVLTLWSLLSVLPAYAGVN